ncbi:MAG: LysM peptidoglycan-binding domain-containing protein [Propionivibrio sp.]|nr:LysM peptidoglycan-binding domain-containing protein [Propionivibrio sp.]
MRRGETLNSVARRYGISVVELKRINQLRDNRIAPGKQLTLTPVSSSTATAKTEASPGKVKVTSSRQPGAKTSPKVTRYTVRRGDTLYSIARQFQVTTDDLIRWNRVSARKLQPGQTLTIQLALNP